MKSSALVWSFSNVCGSAPIALTPCARAIGCWARGAAGIPPDMPSPGSPPPGGPSPGPPRPPSKPSPSGPPPGRPPSSGSVCFIPFWNFVVMSVNDKTVVPFEAALGMVVVWVVVVVAIAILASTCCSGMNGCMGLFLIC